MMLDWGKPLHDKEIDAWAWRRNLGGWLDLFVRDFSDGKGYCILVRTQPTPTTAALEMHYGARRMTLEDAKRRALEIAVTLGEFGEFDRYAELIQ